MGGTNRHLFGAARRRARSHQRRRAVSEVVATVILLAMTVVLFSVVFLVLNRLPSPTPEPTSQFATTLTYSGPNKIVSVAIRHLAGPVLTGTSAGQASIYFRSLNRSLTLGPYLLSQGLPGASTKWALGQTWNLTLSTNLFAPDSLTILIYSQSQLLYDAVLDAVTTSAAPYLTHASVTPSAGGSFSHSSASAYYVNASVVCPGKCATTNSVKVNYTEFAGVLTAPVSLTCTWSVSGAIGQCSWLSGSVKSPTTAGTYVLFVTVTDLAGQTGTLSVTVTVA